MPRKAVEATPKPRASEEEIEQARKSFRWYGENVLAIQSKEGGPLVPLKLNYTQKCVRAEIKRMREAGVPPRIIVLKSRQVGVSTVAEATLFHECHLWPNQSALVLAHNMKSSKALFRMTKRFADNLPEKWKQERRYDNVHEIQFENDSRLQVETVGEVRGYTAAKVHLSEMAFYEQARETMQAVMQVVPRSKDSVVIIESTANGSGNEFHKIWLAAVKAQSEVGLPMWERGWCPIFIPWFKHGEYMMKPWFEAAQTTQEERLLAKQYSLNMRQLAWRRWCIKFNCGDDKDVFKVEYPSNWTEAFMMSGRPVFDPEAMGHHLAAVPPEVPLDTLPEKQEIELVSAGSGPVRHRITPVEEGRLRIYAPPQDRHSYILGVDPSEGDPKSDPTPIEVLDQMTLDHVAEWHGRQPPDVLARTAMALGYYYNVGMIAPEANNHGILFHSTVLNADYPNLYYRVTDEQSVAGQVTQKPGFLTTSKSKHAAFDTFRAWVREKKGKTRSPILVGEMLTLIYKRNDFEQETKILAQAGCYRDAVTAFAIALWAHRGSEANPLEPLPVEQVESVALQAALLRERNPEAAERLSLDIFGLTCDELIELDERRSKMKAQQNSFSAESMR